MVIEDKEDTACPRKITSIAPITLVNKIRLTLTLYIGLPRTEATLLVIAKSLTENII